MDNKSWPQTQLLPLALVGLMALTRFDHFGSAFTLPDATLAVFFFAGLGFSPAWFLGVLLLEAGLIDYIAIAGAGVSDFCISPAYIFLIPAYSVLWLAGRMAAAQSGLHVGVAFKVLFLAAASTAMSFIVSNGSFYLLSGRFGMLSLGGYFTQLFRYFPPYFVSALIYIVIGMTLAKLWQAIQTHTFAES